jgi:hypothetical protein
MAPSAFSQAFDDKTSRHADNRFKTFLSTRTWSAEGAEVAKSVLAAIEVGSLEVNTIKFDRNAVVDTP